MPVDNAGRHCVKKGNSYESRTVTDGDSIQTGFCPEPVQPGQIKEDCIIRLMPSIAIISVTDIANCVKQIKLCLRLQFESDLAENASFFQFTGYEIKFLKGFPVELLFNRF